MRAKALPPEVPLSQLRQDRWTTQDGLPQSSVHSVLQSRRGFLWLGTQEGLVRFDGVDFEIFDRQTYPELRSNVFSALAETRDGSLWAGSVEGLLRLQGDRRTLFGSEDGLSSDYVNALAVSADDTLWVGTNQGLDRRAQGQIRPVEPDPQLARALGQGVYALRVAPGDRLWVATHGAGLIGLPIGPASDGREAVHWTREDGLSSDTIYDVGLDAGGGLWIATAAGVDHLRADGEIEKLRSPKIEGRPIYSIHQDRDGNLWAGSVGQGVFRLVEGREEHWSDPDAPKLIRTLFEDGEGSLWIGSTDGSGFWRLGVGALSTLDDRQGLSHNQVYAVFEDSRGNQWFGSFGGGLDRLDPEGRWRNWGQADGLTHDLVWSLAEDRSGTLWVGTFGGGLYRLVDDRVLPALTTDDGLSDDFIRTLAEDRGGAIWIGSRRGLDRWIDGSIDRFDNTDGLPSSGILSLYETREGVLMVGTTDGLARWDGERFEHLGPHGSMSDESIYAVHESPDGSLWLGTQSQGLLRYRDGRFTALGSEQGLYDNLVYSILEDGQGYLWMSCNRGLQRVARQQLEAVAEGRLSRVTPQIFGARDGMGSAETNGGSQPVAWRRRDGSLIFATIAGVAKVHPDRLEDRGPPAPTLDALWLDHQQHRLDGRETSWIVPPNVRRLTFDFTAPALSRAERLHFRYRLEGFDARWSPASTERSVSFTDLPPGKYRFEVVVGDPGGAWGTETAHLAVVVRAPWWRARWAVAGYGLGLLLLTGLLVRRQRRRIARERAIHAELRAVARTKSALLANTSHELRTPLYGMIGLAEAQLARSEKLDGPTRDGLRQIVTSGQRLGELVDNLLTLGLDPSPGAVEIASVDLGHLVRAVVLRLRSQAEDQGLEVIAQVPPGLTLNTERKLLIQVLLHLVGNAIKFTPEGSVRIAAERAGRGLRMTVEDTGVGIAPEVMGRLFEPFEQADATAERRFGGVGLGLAVTRRRVEQLGGTIEIDSQQGRGTRVEVTFPAAIIRRVRDPRDTENEGQGPSIPSHGVRRAPSQPPRVLVVDDEAINRLLLHSQLEHAGFAVTDVGSGPEALELFDRVEDAPPFDLVVLDIMMPDMSGYEVCRRLRRRFENTTLPVLFLSARDQVADILEGFEAGGDDYLIKPAHHEELVRRLKALLPLEA